MNKKGQEIGGILVLVGIVVVVILAILFGTFYTIQAGERGVLLTWGDASMTPVTEGLHVKMPLMQSIVKFDIKTQKYEADASASSSDLQIVTAKIATNYRIEPEKVATIYKTLGVDYAVTIIQPAEQEAVKSITAKFTAAELVSKREEVRQDIKDLLISKLSGYDIVVQEVSIINFDFSQSFNNAIELKVTQEQNSLAAQNKLAQIQFEAQQVAAKAEGEKNAKIASAEGDAQAIKIINEQLRQSPSYIEYLKVSKWDGHLSQVVGSGVPLINLATSTMSQSDIVNAVGG